MTSASRLAVAASFSSRVEPLDFRALYDHELDFVWRNLRRLGVADADIDDRVQEVFLTVHRRLPEYEERGHGPRAWIFQIVVRVAAQSRRKRRREPLSVGERDSAHAPAGPPTQETVAVARQSLELLDRALARLDDTKRVVVVMHEIEEMSAPEIAEVLGIPLNTVYSRIRLARRDLESALAIEREKGGCDAR